MQSEIMLNISKKDYKIKLDDDFAPFFERVINKYLGGKTQFEVKDLLFAFLQKCHDDYKQEAHINGIVGNLSKTLDEN